MNICYEHTVMEMEFSFMPRKVKIDAVSIVRWLQVEYLAEVVYVLSGPGENFLQSSKESVALGNGEERNTRSFGLIGDESV